MPAPLCSVRVCLSVVPVTLGCREGENSPTAPETQASLAVTTMPAATLTLRAGERAGFDPAPAGHKERRAEDGQTVVLLRQGSCGAELVWLHALLLTGNGHGLVTGGQSGGAELRTARR